MNWNRPLIVGLLVLIAALAWWRLQPAGGEVRQTRLLMGTTVEIVVNGDDTVKLEAAVAAAVTEMERLDRLLSRHRDDSDVARLSQSPTGATVAPETVEVIALGLEIARRSNGAFDLTLGRLNELWDLESASPVVPENPAIARALTGIGPDAVVVEGLQVIKRSPQLHIDLGGIAKGYVVDRAIALLKAQGVTSAAVNAGGDMFLLGERPQRPWRIGIQHPRQQDGVLEAVQVSDRAVVTSGDYERFFERDGVRYHHLFDPQSGLPARGCQSVTVIADSVALADALATAVFVLGPQPGLALLSGYPQTAGLIIAADGTRHATPTWAAYRVQP